MTQKRIKLAKAEINVLNDPQQSGLLFNTAVDKMELPKDYQKLVKMCRFFYKHDPIAGTVVNKMVDCAITPVRNRQALANEDELLVYNSMVGLMQEFFRNVCLEYLLSGLVIPHYEWAKVSGNKLHPSLNSRRRMWIQDNFWFRDPATLVVKASPVIPNKKYFFVKVDSAFIYFIQNKGKMKDGTTDKETYNILVKNYPDFVKKVEESKGTKIEFLLEDIRPILVRCFPEDPYPIPYMENIFQT